MFAPFEVVPYSPEIFCLIVERATATPFHRVRQKRQISYLHNYITHWTRHVCPNENKAVFMVVENHYLDQHYIEDHSQYYQRCFHEYPRECTRLHFFIADSLTAQSFSETLCNSHGKNEAEQKSLEEQYLGFVVVRPIPETFLARICLRIYPNLEPSKPNICLLSQKSSVSLFGLKLTVQSSPFQEQDRVLSACATSALWSFFHAHPCLAKHNIPSSISITRSAYPDNPGMDSLFTNLGLSPDMICRSIRSQGLEPLLIKWNEAEQHLLQEHIYAYCSGRWPAIVGLEAKGGLHAVTVLGYRLAQTVNNAGIRLRSHRIDQLYLHDDRIGPFASLDKMDPIKEAFTWNMRLRNRIATEETFETTEGYKPQNAIFGLYHKVRIPYVRIKRTCISLVDFLGKFCTALEMSGQDQAARFQALISLIEWDIRITEVQSFKESLLELPSEYPEKVEWLTRGLPRFIWSVKCWINDSLFSELIFDATDIPQGNSFLGFVYHDKLSRSLFKSFGHFCEKSYDYITNKNEFDRIPEDHLWGIVNHFRQQQNYGNTLDGLFGKLKTPNRIKPEELNRDAVHNQNAKVLAGPDQNYSLDLKTKYIWVIDRNGSLVIGHEDTSQGQEYGGHPTLLCGAPGRIAGELHYDEISRAWRANAESGRYSKVNFDTFYYADTDAMVYLENAVNARIKPYLGLDACAFSLKRHQA